VVAGRVAVCETDGGLGGRSPVRMCLRSESMSERYREAGLVGIPAGMAELADAADSKSADRKVVGVRPPLPAP
jgi:hypothetical protein